jgi:3-methyl-2-oxobutanoate hydroxymethyltransferase
MSDAAGSERRQQRPVRVHDLRALKQRGEKFIMVAAWDFLTGHILDRAGVPVIPVGDSLGMFALGYQTLAPVTLDEMIHHTRAVRRAVRRALVVADLPFGSYEAGTDCALESAVRLVKESGADAVKIEGSTARLLSSVTTLVETGIPVMGHLGFRPQSAATTGGFVTQGRTEDAIAQMIADGRRLQEAGIFAVVLERVPPEAASRVTAALDIPTIGAGAGPHTDAQIALLPWLFGLIADDLPEWFRQPRWAKTYAPLLPQMLDGIESFRHDVASGKFPGPEHTYASEPRDAVTPQ